MRLKDKVALVTGAASGIGRETALLFAREGARVIVCDRDADQGADTAAMIHAAGGDALFLRCDVADEAEVQASMQQGIAHFGRLNVLCNNAGIGPPADTHITALDWEVFEEVWRVNVGGVFLCSKHGVPHLIAAGGGSVINMASIAGLVGAITAPVTAYGTSKAAVLGLTKQMAAQLAGQNVRVNAICPGPTETAILAPFLHDPAVRQRYAQRTPLRRMGQPQDIANLCLYLASDESAYMTGSILIIDGGITTL